MDLYLYETHLHTAEASACAILTGAEQARLYKKLGYAGIIVTDHFFNGNTAIPKDLPWEERVDLFRKGYDNARKEGEKIGLSVFFGWEANYDGTEFLIYGLEPEWIKSHPEMLSWPVEEQYRQIHAAGGFVVHAHPFRMRSYIKEIRLFPDSVDAVEVYNVGNRSVESDSKASEYAKKHNLPGTAGTDAHGFEPSRSGLAFYEPLKDINDLIKNVKDGNYRLIMNA